jgi:hypothetical protein
MISAGIGLTKPDAGVMATNPATAPLAAPATPFHGNFHGTVQVEDGDDGVVEYKSAHIDGVESELIVRSGHSTQATPATIEEVRRILYDHAGIH